jgi:RAD51-like protein 2
VIVVNQLATKLFTAENKQGNFDTGDKAILMPQLGESERG